MKLNKMNVFKQLYFAVAKPYEYHKLTKVSLARAFCFILLLLSVTQTIGTALPIFSGIYGSKGLLTEIKDQLPYFQMKNGKLHSEEPYYYVDETTFICINTDVEEFSYNDIGKMFDVVILVGKTNMFLYREGRTAEYDFNRIPFRFDNRIIDQLMPTLLLFLILGLVVIYLIRLAGYLLSALFYSLIGMMVSSSDGLELPYRKIFITALYGKVGIHLLYTIIDLVDPTMPKLVRSLLSIIATCIYIYIGIRSHKNLEREDEAVDTE